MPNVPGAMVSSTFYDLRQIRDDLRIFIEEELGYRALLSEHPSFPIEPDIDTIENCRRRVEQDADILVLVIGNRYGSIDADTSKSITNLEYLAARAKGIPVYAFVEDSVLTLYSLWQRSKKDDAAASSLTTMVDDVRLFEFIERVTGTDRVWRLGFKTASDIIKALRTQFAFLMTDGLKLRMRVSTSGIEDTIKHLSPTAYRIALEKPKAWEYLLFAQVLTDEVAKFKGGKKEYDLGIALGPGERLDIRDAIKWIQAKNDELLRMVAATNRLVGETLNEGFGPPGQAGDVEIIVFVANQLGMVFGHFLEWAKAVRRVHVDPNLRRAFELSALMPSEILDEMQAYGPRVTGLVNEALSRPPDGTVHEISAIMKFTVSETVVSAFSAEMDRLTREIDHRQWGLK